MGAVAAIRILHRRTLAAVPPTSACTRSRPSWPPSTRAPRAASSRAVELGVIDEIIEPSRTRRELARAIAEAPQLRGVHANIPL